MTIGTKHKNDFDSLYAWVITATGQPAWDGLKDYATLEVVQFDTFAYLCDEHKLHPYNESPEKYKEIEAMCEKDWIFYAKKFGVLRKRTKDEREKQNAEIDASFQSID